MRCLIYFIILAFTVVFLSFFGEFVNYKQFSFYSPDAKNDDNITFIPPFHSILTDYLTSSDYNITTCLVRKSMSQMAFNTMCLLYDTENFLEGNHKLNETWHKKRACSYSDPEFATFSKNYTPSSNFTNLVFIRDPFDRFLSLYLDKCVREHRCYDCDEDMRCVVREIYKSLKEQTINDETFMDKHSAPTSWFCGFQKYLKTYNLLVIGSDLQERKEPVKKLSEILEKKGVPSYLISKIVEELLVGETEHGTHTSTRRKIAAEQIKNDPVVRKYLHKIYFNDYLIFPFDRSHLDPEYQESYWDEKYKEDYADYIKIQDSNVHSIK